MVICTSLTTLQQKPFGVDDFSRKYIANQVVTLTYHSGVEGICVEETLISITLTCLYVVEVTKSLRPYLELLSQKKDALSFAMVNIVDKMIMIKNDSVLIREDSISMNRFSRIVV